MIWACTHCADIMIHEGYQVRSVEKPWRTGACDICGTEDKLSEMTDLSMRKLSDYCVTVGNYRRENL
jgi:hypothetical protein